ncbi:hypothetical protein B0H12DRAFT_246482 [Mycena haematopus]|nr:hypothetical protein B0H12DRAFT_246482 [Mycena haematopus]
MNDRRQQDKRIIRRSERQIQQLIEDAELKSDTHTAVESSLLAQVSELTVQIADLEAQVNPLRAELAKYQHRANPLPPPPEPVPSTAFLPSPAPPRIQGRLRRVLHPRPPAFRPLSQSRPTTHRQGQGQAAPAAARPVSQHDGKCDHPRGHAQPARHPQLRRRAPHARACR